MNDSQFAVFNNLEPINKDFNQLARIYGHNDSSTTVAGGQKRERDNKKKKKKSDRKKGKKNRRRQASVSESVTVETTDEGRKVVTFITWAGE
jgi:hypothetical protein